MRPTCAGCGKKDLPDSMGCPTCAKLGLPPSYFCTQACFKENWSKHKKVHKAVENAFRHNKSLDRTVFENYRYTGPLRPFPFSHEMRGVPTSAKIELPDWAVTGIPEIEAKANRSGRTSADLLATYLLLKYPIGRTTARRSVIRFIDWAAAASEPHPQRRLTT